MSISISNNINFKGYDVMPLRGFYMQGWGNYAGEKITKEMLQIAKKENLLIFINNCGQIVKNTVQYHDGPIIKPSVWGQDSRIFVKNKGMKTLICNLRDGVQEKNNLGELSDYNVSYSRFLPRGGTFYIGFMPSGEKRMLISSKAIVNWKYDDSIKNNKKIGLLEFHNYAPKEHIADVFGVDIKKIDVLNTSYFDLDMLIRPIGFPYVLVHDRDEALKNIEKFREKFPYSDDIYQQLQEFANYENIKNIGEDSIRYLEEHGFKPIRIGGMYLRRINFLNALAFRKKSGGISYITNSTRDSKPEIEYLEELFEEDLRAKVNNIENVYFVSGGNAKINGFSEAKDDYNSIMYWLEENRGGIHCMTAEIPNFS